MDLARVLAPESDDSDGGDAGHTINTASVDSASVEAPRAAKSQALVQPQRRVTKLGRLRAQTQSLEWVLANADALFSTELPLDAVVEAKVTRIRMYRRRDDEYRDRLAQEMKVQSGYYAQLRQHRQSAAGIRILMRGVELDSWFWRCERWRAIATEYYKPFSRDECERMFSDTLDMIAAYKMPQETRRDKPSAFGWRDIRWLDDNQCSVHFQSHKTIGGLNIDDAVGICWRIYHDPNLFQFMVGEHTQLHFHILQQEILQQGEVMVLQLVEKPPGLSTMAHSLYLVFYMKTKTGYTIGMRSVESPDLKRAMQDEHMSEACTFYWTSWDVTKRDPSTGECTEFVARLNGFIGSSDPAYAHRWVLEGLIVLVRLEHKLYGTNALPLVVPSTA